MRLELPGTSFTAWVSVEGVEAEIFQPEYTNDKNGPVTTCWIESQAGKPFAVSWRDSERQFASSGLLYLDGIQDSTAYAILQKDRAGDGTVTRARAVTSLTTSKPFMFAELELSDEDALLDQAGTADLGEIRICLKRIETTGTVQRTFGALDLEQGKKIHERSKKAGAHRVQLGESIREDNSSTLNTMHCLGPIGTFIFRYRSRALLQANDIMPRPIARAPTPTEAEEEDAEDAAKAEEIQRLEARLQELRGGKRKIKSEPEQPSKRIKKEKKNQPLHSTEVIDLT